MGGGREGTVHSNTSPRRPTWEEGRGDQAPHGWAFTDPRLHSPCSSSRPFPRGAETSLRSPSRPKATLNQSQAMDPTQSPAKTQEGSRGLLQRPLLTLTPPLPLLGTPRALDPEKGGLGGLGEAAHTAPARGSPWAYWACASPGTRKMPLSEGCSTRTGPTTAAGRPPLVLLC